MMDEGESAAFAFTPSSKWLDFRVFSEKDIKP